LEGKTSTRGKGSNDTLNPVGMVNLEESPWCSPCQEPHPEDECPRREEDSHDSMNFIDTICTFQDDDEYVDIMKEQLDEVRKRGAREGRLRVLN
jgi:hypothetical protein